MPGVGNLFTILWGAYGPYLMGPIQSILWESWSISGMPQRVINFKILPFPSISMSTSERYFSSLCCLHVLLVMEFRFEAMLCSNFGERKFGCGSFSMFTWAAGSSSLPYTRGSCTPRGTFKVSNRREKYVYMLFISNYLYIYQ